MKAEPYQQRVIEEKQQLDERLGRLNDFFTTATFHQLDDDEQYLLKRQAEVMKEYSEILEERIDGF